MTSLPTWAVYLVSLGLPVAAFVGVLIAQSITRKGAKELDRRSRREELMRNLRWASELAVDTQDDARADLGVAQLAALLQSDLLDPAEQVFVEATLGVVYEDPAGVLERLGASGGAVYDAGVDVVADADENPEQE